VHLAKLEGDSLRILLGHQLEVLHRGVSHPAAEIQAVRAQLQGQSNL